MSLFHSLGQHWTRKPNSSNSSTRRRKQARQQRRGFLFEALEDRRVMAFASTLTAPNSATISGDGGNDTLQITVASGLLVHNRFTAGDAGFNSDIDWDTTTAGDQTLAANALTAVRIDTGLGSDNVKLGSPTSPASDLLAAINYNSGGPSGDILTVDDSARVTANTYTSSSSGLTATGINLTIGTVVSGGRKLITGQAADTVRVNSSFGGEPQSFDSAGGVDDITLIGSGISGTITVTNTPSKSKVTIDNSAESTARSVIVGSTFVTGSSAASINFTAGDLETLLIKTGTNADSIFVAGTDAGVPTSIESGNGNDGLTLDVGVSLNGGTLNGGAGNNTLSASGTFLITGSDQGTVNGEAFQNIGTLIGGTGDDVFRFQTAGALSRFINGSGGTNTIFNSTGAALVKVSTGVNQGNLFRSSDTPPASTLLNTSGLAANGYVNIQNVDATPSLVVTTASDEDDGTSDPSFGTGTSLREAIAYANSKPGADTITFGPSLAVGGPVTINVGITGDNTFGPTAFLITSEITITGPTGANGITIARDTTAAPTRLRFFNVGQAGALTLNNLTLTDGSAVGGSGGVGGGGGGGGAGLGGAIVNQGRLTINSSTLSNNRAIGGNGATPNNFAGGGGGGGLAGNGLEAGNGSGSYGSGGDGGGPNGATGSVTNTNAASGGFGGGGAASGLNSGSAGMGGFGGGGGGSGNSGGSGGAGGFGGGGGGGDDTSAGGAGGFGAAAGAGGSFNNSGGGGAGLGGAIFNYGGTLQITNSTLTNNAAGGGNGGDGAQNGSGLGSEIFNLNGRVILLNSTLVTTNANSGQNAIYNLGDNGVATQAGPALPLTTAHVELINTVLSNSSGQDYKSEARNGGSELTTGTNVLFAGATTPGANYAVQNILTGDPSLGSLANNGGPTQTMLPTENSPLVDAGLNAADEVQTLAVSGAAGTFTLTFNGATTSPLAFNSSTGSVETALNGLSTIGGVGGSVTVTQTGLVLRIKFGGSLAGTNVPLITALAAGGATATVSEFTSGFTLQASGTDQRGTGFPRIISGTVDIGALEFPAAAPAVTTPTATNIALTTSTLGGNVTDDGGATITERGIVWSITSLNNNPQIGGASVTQVTTPGTTGVFTIDVTALPTGTQISYAAYATNSVGTTYTTVGTFTTQPTIGQFPGITVQILGGQMIVTGTEQDDTIKVATDGMGGYIVTANKLINGLPSPQSFSGATSFVANTLGGHDDLWLAAPLTLDSVTVDLGNGNDRLVLGADPNNAINNNVLDPQFGTLGYLTVNGPVSVIGGEGNDRVIERSTDINGVKTINLGEGNNEYNVYWGFSNETIFSSGAGTDNVYIGYLSSREASQFDTGAGNDLISYYASRFYKTAYLNSGAGADTVALDVNIYDEATTVDTGSEADYLLFSRSVAYKSVVLTTAAGADTVLIGKYISGLGSNGAPIYSNGGSNIDDLTLNTGVEADTVQVAANVMRLFFANLGDAYDDAEVEYNLFTDGFLDGGGQDMRLRLRGNAGLRTRNPG